MLFECVSGHLNLITIRLYASTHIPQIDSVCVKHRKSIKTRNSAKLSKGIKGCKGVRNVVSVGCSTLHVKHSMPQTHKITRNDPTGRVYRLHCLRVLCFGTNVCIFVLLAYDGNENRTSNEDKRASV